MDTPPGPSEYTGAYYAIDWGAGIYPLLITSSDAWRGTGTTPQPKLAVLKELELGYNCVLVQEMKSRKLRLDTQLFGSLTGLAHRLPSPQQHPPLAKYTRLGHEAHAPQASPKTPCPARNTVSIDEPRKCDLTFVLDALR